MVHRLRFLVLILAMAASAAIAPSTASPAPAKRALLIGVSSYDRGGPHDWTDLHGEADVTALSTMLQRRFGFAEENIRLLTGPDRTTHDAILNAFREWLIEPTRPGDIIYFHYSGHGTTIPDDDGDELDGLDESLVPSDYVSKKDGSRNIRDDELADLLDSLAAKSPANVTLTFDCCYSGTATRAGRMLVRGQGWMGDVPPPAAGAAPDGGSGIAGAGHPDAAGYVVISATSQGQLAAEVEGRGGEQMGLLTHALVAAAETAGPETTYRDLYERVADIMLRYNRRQTPQIEGRIDQHLFAGTAAPPTTYVPVTGDPGGGLYLEAGSLQGVTAGSRYAIHASGTRDFHEATPLAMAAVSRVDLSYAELTVEDPDVDPARLRAARAVEIEHAYGDRRLKLDIAAIEDPALREVLAAMPLVDVSTTAAARWDVRISPLSDGRLRLERRDGSELAVLDGGAEAGGLISSLLEGESRWSFIQDLENRDPYAQVGIELRVAPVEVRTDERGRVLEILGDLDLGRDRTGRLAVPEGTYVMIELRNTGYVDAYVTVLDLRGQGGVGPLWPYPGLRVQDNRILADGKWVRIPAPFIFRIEGPGGPEMFKAIATAEPADFSPLLDRETIERLGTRRDPPPRELGTPLGKLLRSVTMGERGESAVAPGKWATATVNFEVVNGP